MQLQNPIIKLCAILLFLCACQRQGPTSAYSVQEASAHPQSIESVMLLGLSNSILPEELFTLPHLKSLEIIFSRLDTLPSGLKKARKLKYLMLDGNRFLKIPESVTELPSLELLSLGTNPNLDGPQAPQLPFYALKNSPFKYLL